MKLELGKTYKTKGGSSISIVDIDNDTKGYETVLGSDGLWRYNREGDYGRVTGVGKNFSENLIIE